MKRILLISLILSLCAGQSFAGYYVPNQATVSSMSLQGNGTNTITGPLTKIPNSPSPGSVDFSAQMLYTTDGGITRTNGQASTSIGLSGLPVDLSSYSGFAMEFLNTNNSEWFVELYIKGSTNITSGTQVSILPGSGVATQVVLDFTGLDVTNVTDIGFWVYGNMEYPVLNTGNPSNPDTFNIAVVPIPATILLGLLGLGVGGWKLRKSIRPW